MKRLTHRDVSKLLSGLATLHSDADPATLPARWIKTAREVLSFDFLSIDQFNRNGWYLKKSWQDPVDWIPVDLMEVFAHYLPEHPLHHELLRSRVRIPRKMSDYVTTGELHRRGIYNEFFKKARVEHLISVGVDVDADLTIAFTTGKGGKDFTETDRELLTVLRPHLVASYRNAEFYSGLQSSLQLIERAMELIGSGILILNLNRTVKMMSEQASILLSRYFGARQKHGSHLPEELLAWVADRQQHAEEIDGRVRFLPLEVTRRAGLLRITLMHDIQNEQLILSLKEETTTEPAEGLLKIGLSRREAEVLVWVMKGKADTEIAALCGISPRTVQKHLEHVYQKLGVESRNAAARMASDMIRI